MFQRIAAARRPRHAARSEIRRRIIEAMREQRRADMPFDLFMDVWLQDPVDGLRLAADPRGPGTFTVTDEDAIVDSSATYSLKTLRDTFWPIAGRQLPTRH